MLDLEANSQDIREAIDQSKRTINAIWDRSIGVEEAHEIGVLAHNIIQGVKANIYMAVVASGAPTMVAGATAAQAKLGQAAD